MPLPCRGVNVFFARQWFAETMGSAEFILVINLFVAGLLAAAFMTIAAYDAGRVSAR